MHKICMTKKLRSSFVSKHPDDTLILKIGNTNLNKIIMNSLWTAKSAGFNKIQLWRECLFGNSNFVPWVFVVTHYNKRVSLICECSLKPIVCYNWFHLWQTIFLLSSIVVFSWVKNLHLALPTRPNPFDKHWSMILWFMHDWHSFYSIKSTVSPQYLLSRH